jgi:hypothetical protein
VPDFSKTVVIDLLEKKRSATRAALITELAILIVVFILAYLLHFNYCHCKKTGNIWGVNFIVF